ncbi:MAG TPA: selenocysteine-specific translation elongation factor [Jiangellales bacterium]|nr:selenocysteine-specific translation elongation factor [Jiangellales bacterium]
MARVGEIGRTAVAGRRAAVSGMYVIATAGHVDHGKSALLRALTGMEPDRWEEERRRGLTIDLGFVWTAGDRGPIAFVDVPGHERFVGNMLAGVGPVPAVLFVVAADEGWMPQSAEHLMALHALGVRHGLLAVTKTDLMEPDLAAEEALDHIRGTSLGEIDWVGVSARTGVGLARLRAALDDLVARLPASDASAPVRLWVDRSFSIRGAGLVVTGTLAAGTVRSGDTLELARTSGRFVVREVQSLNQRVDEAVGVARVALNLRGAGRGEIHRGDALMTPGTYRLTAVADVRARLCVPADLPRELLVHAGTATVGCGVRPIGADTARLTLDAALPLRVGDRVVLRHDRGVAGGAVVLDVDPSPLRRRGAARRRAGELEGYPDAPDGMSELRRRGIVREGTLRAIGVAPPLPPIAGDWLVAPDLDRALRERLTTLVARRAHDPSAVPLKVDDARKALELPDARLVPALLTPPLVIRDGVIVHAEAPDTLAPKVRAAVGELERRLADGDFTVPTEDELAALGLGTAEIASAVRAGRLLRLAPGVVLLPDTVRRSVGVLAGLPQPFTASEAREALGTTRKVIVPLLEYLAQAGRTRRAADGRHTVTGR